MGVPADEPQLGETPKFGSTADEESADAQWELLKSLQVPGYVEMVRQREEAARDTFRPLTAAIHNASIEMEAMRESTRGDAAMTMFLEAAVGKIERALLLVEPLSFLGEVFDELNAAEEQIEEFYWIEVALDSGAANHVMSREDAPGYTVEESEGSRRGQKFQGASGRLIPNEGKIALNLLVSKDDDVKEFIELESTFQIAKVTRPLLSVSKICQSGQLDVLCRQDEAFILGKQHKVLAKFERKGGLYVAQMAVRNPKFSGFSRQAK